MFGQFSVLLRRVFAAAFCPFFAVVTPPVFGGFSQRKLSTVRPIFPPANKRSKNGENRVKSRVYGDFSVEKTVENVKD